MAKTTADSHSKSVSFRGRESPDWAMDITSSPRKRYAYAQYHAKNYMIRHSYRKGANVKELPSPESPSPTYVCPFPCKEESISSRPYAIDLQKDTVQEKVGTCAYVIPVTDESLAEDVHSCP